MLGFLHASSAQGITHTARNKLVILFRCGSSSKSSLQGTAPAASRTAVPGDGKLKDKGENLPRVNKMLDLTLS
eukprot:5986512-Ditylum_brightwellii.AAC.1